MTKHSKTSVSDVSIEKSFLKCLLAYKLKRQTEEKKNLGKLSIISLLLIVARQKTSFEDSLLTL
jgi:hypothetical protein